MTGRAVDYSSATPPPAAEIKNAGYRLVLRYLSRYTGKTLHPAERDALLKAGLDIALVFEDYADNALHGVTQGMADGAFAASQAKSLRYPRRAVIYAAVDCDTTWQATRPYLEAFADQLNAVGYQMGVYGGINVVTGAHTAHPGWRLWQTRAWSGTPPRIHPNAALYQRPDCVSIASVSCDVNDILRPDYGGWRETKRRRVPSVVLRVGAHRALVRLLQRRLNRHGWHLVVDGWFGLNTLHAVESFQRSHRLTVDGIVGRHTWRALLGRTK